MVLCPTDSPNAECYLPFEQRPVLQPFPEWKHELSVRNGIREKTLLTFCRRLSRPTRGRTRGFKVALGCQLISRSGKVRVRALVTDRVQGR